MSKSIFMREQFLIRSQFVWRIVHLRIVHMRIVSFAKCPFASCPLAKCHIAKSRIAKSLFAKRHIAKSLITKCRTTLAKSRMAKCPFADCLFAKCPGTVTRTIYFAVTSHSCHIAVMLWYIYLNFPIYEYLGIAGYDRPKQDRMQGELMQRNGFEPH